MIFFYFFVFIMPLTNHPLWSRFIGDLTLTKYVGAGCLVYAIIYLFRRASFPRPLRSPLAMLFGLFVLMALFSSMSLSLPRDWQLSPLFSYVSFVLLLFIAASVIDSESRLKRTLYVAIGAVAFASLYLIREWQVYRNVYVDFRPGWITGDANYFTLSTLLCLPLALYLLNTQRPRVEKLFLLGCIVVTLLAVTLAASRGGFLGLVAALLFILLHSSERIRRIAVIGVILVPLLLFFPLSPLKRLVNPDHSDQVAAQDRVIVWKAGLHMIEEHPWRGIGLGNFKPMVLQYEYEGRKVDSLAHNTYIEVAAEMGIPCFVLFLAIFATAFRALGRTRAFASEKSPFLSQSALGMQAGLVGAMVAIFFLSAEAQKLLWLAVFLAPCMEYLARSASSGEELVSGPIQMGEGYEDEIERPLEPNPESFEWV